MSQQLYPNFSTGGSSSNATKIQSIDVASTIPTNGQALTYSTTNARYEPTTISTSGTIPDASSSVKGLIQLTNDLGGTASSPTVPGLSLKANQSTTYTKSEVDSALGAKANTSHTHISTNISDFNEAVDDRVAVLIVAGSGISKTYDDVNNTLTLTSTASGGGEINTASNVGVGGIGLYKQKTGANLEFKNINAASSKISVANDTTNNEVDIDVVEANLSLGNISGTITDTQHGSRTGGTLHSQATTSIDGFMSSTDKTKLNGIATGATANSTDATLLSRTNHTGTQAFSTITGTVPITQGGTGVTTTPTNGQLLIGNGTGYTASTLTAGSNITITNTAGGISIASTAGGSATIAVQDEGTQITATLNTLNFVGAGVVASNNTGNVTITVPGTGIGDAVLKQQTYNGTPYEWSAKAIGSMPSGPNYIQFQVPTSNDGSTDGLLFGSLLINKLGIITNATWQGSAIGLLYGGTGSTTASGARTNLGLGSAAVLAETSASFNANRIQSVNVSSTAPTNGQVLTFNSGSGNIVWSSPADTTTFLVKTNNLSDLASVATARTNLGLGSAAVLSENTASFNANKLQGISISTTSPTDGQQYVYSNATTKWELATAGQANTASNIGVGGVGIYKQKTGVNIELRNINVGSNKLSIVLDNTNNEVDLDIVEANLTHDNIGGTLGLTKGGTGATTASAARTNLGLGSAALLAESTASFNANKLQGVSVNVASPTDGQVLKYDAATTSWKPGADNTASGGGSGLILKYNVVSSTSTTTAGTSVVNSMNGTSVLDSGSIAPASTTSVFVLTYSLNGITLSNIASTGYPLFFYLYRSIGGATPTLIKQFEFRNTSETTAAGNYFSNNWSSIFLDSPATTSSVQYVLTAYTTNASANHRINNNTNSSSVIVAERSS